MTELEITSRTSSRAKGTEAVVRIANESHSLEITVLAYPDGRMVANADWTDPTGRKQRIVQMNDAKQDRHPEFFSPASKEKEEISH